MGSVYIGRPHLSLGVAVICNSSNDWGGTSILPSYTWLVCLQPPRCSKSVTPEFSERIPDGYPEERVFPESGPEKRKTGLLSIFPDLRRRWARHAITFCRAQLNNAISLTTIVDRVESVKTVNDRWRPMVTLLKYITLRMVHGKQWVKRTNSIFVQSEVLILEYGPCHGQETPSWSSMTTIEQGYMTANVLILRWSLLSQRRPVLQMEMLWSDLRPIWRSIGTRLVWKGLGWPRANIQKQ